MYISCVDIIFPPLRKVEPKQDNIALKGSPCRVLCPEPLSQGVALKPLPGLVPRTPWQDSNVE